MSIHKKIEFAAICKVNTAYISVNIKRGKIQLTPEGAVDDSNPINQAFMNKCLEKAYKRPISGTAVEIDISGLKEVINQKEAKPKKAKNEKISRQNTNFDKYDERFDLETEEKKAKIRKLERETMNADIEHERKVGKLVPTDPTRDILIRTVKNLATSYKQAADKIIEEIAKKVKLNRNDQAEIREKILLFINRATEDGMNESKKSVMIVMKEYSQLNKA